jgi:hypothetical protein
MSADKNETDDNASNTRTFWTKNPTSDKTKDSYAHEINNRSKRRKTQSRQSLGSVSIRKNKRI